MAQSELCKDLLKEASRIENEMRHLRSRYNPDDPDDPRVRLRQELALVHQQMQDAGCFPPRTPVHTLNAVVTEGTLRSWTNSDSAPGPYETAVGPGKQLVLLVNFVKWYPSGPWVARFSNFSFSVANYTLRQKAGAGRFDVVTRQLDLHSELHVDGPLSDFGLDLSSSGSIAPPNISALQGTPVGKDGGCTLVGSGNTTAYNIVGVTVFVQLEAKLSNVPS